MPFQDEHLATVAGWVGKTYSEMEALFPRRNFLSTELTRDADRNARHLSGGSRVGWKAGMRGCWNLIRAAESLRGNAIPEEYYAALDARMYRTVFEPQPWDIIPVCNHRLPIVTHVMLYLGESVVVHALEDPGVISGPITRDPWWSRIARDRSGRRGYLRLRVQPATVPWDEPISPLAHIGVD